MGLGEQGVAGQWQAVPLPGQGDREVAAKETACHRETHPLHQVGRELKLGQHWGFCRRERCMINRNVDPFLWVW